jgi:hypothetical protein
MRSSWLKPCLVSLLAASAVVAGCASDVSAEEEDGSEDALNGDYAMNVPINYPATYRFQGTYVVKEGSRSRSLSFYGGLNWDRGEATWSEGSNWEALPVQMARLTRKGCSDCFEITTTTEPIISARYANGRLRITRNGVVATNVDVIGTNETERKGSFGAINSGW